MAPNDIQSTVRAYSTQVDQRLPPGHVAHDLGQALAQEVDSEILFPDKASSLRRFFEKDASADDKDLLTELVRVEYARLARKLLVFEQRSSKEDRLDDTQFECTIEGVVNMIQKIITRWESKKNQGFANKTKALFHRLCRGINSHSSLLEVLPDGNEYVSLFTGVLTVIIKASANHENVARGFAENLCSINQSIGDIQVDLSLFKIDNMIEAISEFYGHIFLYLSSVLEWIMEKRRTRFIASFNESLVERFEDDIKRISQSAERIRNLAQQSSRAEARYHRLETENANRDIRLGLHGLARQNAEIKHDLEVMKRRQAQIEETRKQEPRYQKQLGYSVKLFLEERTRHEQTTHYALKIVSPDQLDILTQSGLQLEKLDQVTEVSSSDDVALNSRHLEDYFSRDRVRLHANDSAPMPFEPETISRVTDWSNGEAVPMLWIDGPVMDCEEERNPLPMLTAQLIELTARSHLHVISYFCELSRSVEAAEREAQATVSLVYSLIRQLIELLPPEFEAPVDFSEARFRRLDGTLKSCDESMQMFEDLLNLVPAATVFCFIDGLHLVDDKRVEESLQLFLRQLRRDNGKLRVLFTTSGRSACLAKELKVEETLMIDSYRKGSAAYGLDL
ncbi:hypothetical protein J7T55_012135 [Diaporthe amygdali]|uniref:uncharacterized protein n=1 Tax=Phomopsis amygdali TaxID=1214568 RepID=UPI0022FEA963|nr:uncharacterized protein J7T55_012135 [Diaporthe amygdali]KAJ0123668.1 hypothetical protein J7T55_012135 [Diaporthe amygdali]